MVRCQSGLFRTWSRARTRAIQNSRRKSRFPSDGGIGPPILVAGFFAVIGTPSRLSDSKESMLPSSTGRVPAKRLPARLTSRITGNKPNWVGINPVKKLRDKSRICKLASSPKLVGKVVTRELSLIEKTAMNKKQDKVYTLASICAEWSLRRSSNL